MLYNPVDLSKAVNMVARGYVDKAKMGNVTVYRVKDIIRIDIKTPAKEETKEG